MKKGVTLIEVLVALTIIAIALLLLLMIMNRRLSQERRLTVRKMALELARSEMETAISMSDSSLFSSKNSVNYEGKKFPVERKVYPNDTTDLEISLRCNSLKGLFAKISNIFLRCSGIITIPPVVP